VFEHWEIGAGALLGAACFVMGAMIRAGHFRGAVQRTYFRGDIGAFPRTTIFAFMPLGIAIFLIAVAVGLMERHGTLGTDDPDPTVTLLITLGIAALLIAFWWMFQTPEWAKPTWVRDHDRAQPDRSP
jgi:hypothetical protein